MTLEKQETFPLHQKLVVQRTKKVLEMRTKMKTYHRWAVSRGKTLTSWEEMSAQELACPRRKVSMS